MYKCINCNELFSTTGDEKDLLKILKKGHKGHKIIKVKK